MIYVIQISFKNSSLEIPALSNMDLKVGSLIGSCLGTVT